METKTTAEKSQTKMLTISQHSIQIETRQSINMKHVRQDNLENKWNNRNKACLVISFVCLGKGGNASLT